MTAPFAYLEKLHGGRLLNCSIGQVLRKGLALKFLKRRSIEKEWFMDKMKGFRRNTTC